MTEDAIYAALMAIQRELGEQSSKLDNIDGRLDSGDTRMGRIENKLDGRPCISQQGPCPTQQTALPSTATQTAIPPQSAENLLDQEAGAAAVKLARLGLNFIAAHWGKAASAAVTAVILEAFHKFA